MGGRLSWYVYTAEVHACVENQLVTYPTSCSSPFPVRENAVTSCRKCNGRKGALKVNQLKSIGMRLLKEPYTPTQFQLHNIAGQMLPRKVHPSWAPYLGLVDHIVTAQKAGGKEGIYFDDLS